MEVEPPAAEKENLPMAIADPHDLKVIAVRYYAAGANRTQTARAMLDLLAPMEKFGPVQAVRMAKARSKLRSWESQLSFRDLLYQQAVVKADLRIPQILDGVVGKAKRGRVDAARLVLELTGRHNPKGEQTAPNIVVAINGVPRPKSREIEAEVVEMEAIQTGEDPVQNEEE